jgi:hypothetical protein
MQIGYSADLSGNLPEWRAFYRLVYLKMSAARGNQIKDYQ